MAFLGCVLQQATNNLNKGSQPLVMLMLFKALQSFEELSQLSCCSTELKKPLVIYSSNQEVCS
jgi:hypothetical protein